MEPDAMSTDYEPKGRTAILVAAMRRDPNPCRIWSPSEAAAVMDCTINKVCGTVAFAVGHAVIWRVPVGRSMYYSLTKVPGALEPKRATGQAQRRDRTFRACDGWATNSDDIRIPRFDPSWCPPKMVAPRAGSGL
jgi:hypothetical protein